MPIRLCLGAPGNPPCRNTAEYRGRCRTCNTINDRQVTRPGYRIYRSKRWAATREHVLTRQPLCPGLPGEPDCGQIATDVDHIVAIEAGGDPWALTNLQGLCKRCHSIKTRQEQQQCESSTSS